MVDVIGRAKVIVTGEVDRSFDKAGDKIGKGLKVGAAVGVLALGTVTVASVKAFQAFEEAESSSRKLTQVLDNMGESAAAPGVEKLADNLRKLTGIDDEVIKGGQTILATFSEVAESAGDMGGVFERATALTLDLSVSGFGSVDGAAKSLGKALQDPVKGITALGRAGVTFTEEQKKLIKSLVETGEVGEAQNLILAEVEKQVGGTAEASATASQKIGTAVGELQETFGLFVNDIISGGDETKTFADRLEDLNDELIRLQKTDAWKGIAGGIRGIGKAIGFVVDALGAWSDFWYDAGRSFGRFSDSVGADIDFLVDKFRDIPWIGRFIGEGDDPISNGDRELGAADLESLLLSGRAAGGPASGLTLINENGPELVSLPSGSYVHNAPATKEILDGIAAASGGNTTVFNITGPVSLAELRQRAAWYDTYGTRFGGAAG